MKKTLKIVVYLLIFFFGVFVGILCQKRIWSIVDPDIKIGVWELVGIVVAMLGSLGTCAAVVVALAKEKIIRLFTHPTIVASLHDEDGFDEEVDLEQKSPLASEYFCLLDVINKGNVSANECELKIDQIQYADKKGRSLRQIRDDNKPSSSKVPWEGDEKVKLQKDLRKEIVLFKIIQPNSTGTPAVGDPSNIDKAKLSLCGYELKDSHAQHGYWEVSYYLSYDSGEYYHFKIAIEWNGEWKTRQKEMKDVLIVKLLRNENISNNK
mgnify:CR=1 FL=1